MPGLTIQQEIATVEERHAGVSDPVERKELVAATLFPAEPIGFAVTKYEYLVDFGRPLDLEDPKDIAAKLHWLKLYYRNPILGELVDKLAARSVARRKCPDIALPDLYWEGPGLSAVAPAELPKKFVLKANHGWNMNLFCHDADSFDWAGASARTNEWLKFRHERMHGEWAYSLVEPRILIEEMLAEPATMTDYKFYCFSGAPKFLKVDAGRGSVRKQIHVDLDWNPLPIHIRHYEQMPLPARPRNFDEMVVMAGMLAQDLPFVRIDLYNLAGRIYFGEFTLYPCGGNLRFEPPEWNGRIGDLLELPDDPRQGPATG